MMDMHIQAELVEKRGEPCLAAMLREIASDEAARLEKIEFARVRAENVVLVDQDF